MIYYKEDFPIEALKKLAQSPNIGTKHILHELYTKGQINLGDRWKLTEEGFRFE